MNTERTIAFGWREMLLQNSRGAINQPIIPDDEPAGCISSWLDVVPGLDADLSGSGFE